VTEELAWLGAVEIGRRVNAGELDPQAVVAEHLARIGRLNPPLNAYIDVDQNARARSGG
jgi:Asp-tRNA(Asn)/Glu-tRNA(Gln) amidotransferase A subunit family amidase